MNCDVKILLVEDDESLGETLSSRLTDEGYKCHWCKSALQARDALRDSIFNLCILDIGLPDDSGFSLAHEIREICNFPIVFLTAMNSAEYRLKAFEIGVADYIPKPFHLKELLLRLRKVLGDKNEDLLYEEIGKVKFELKTFNVSFTDIAISKQSATLNQRDFELFRYLVSNTPQVVTRSDILSKIFKSGEGTTPRIVDNSIVRIRSQLCIPDGYLRSVRGVGYQWVV